MEVSFKSASKVWGLYLVAVLVSVLFLSSLNTGVIQLVLGVVLLAAFVLLAYSDGAYNGERGCTLNATIEKQVKEGRSVAEQTARYAFSRKTAIVTFVICLIPFLAVSTINLIAEPFFPETVVEEEEEEHEAFYFDYDADPTERETVRTNWAKIVARVLYMPYVFVYERVSNHTLNWLFMLFAFVMPTSQLVGYLSGPRLRKKKLHDIALGKKRKMRNLKVHKDKGPRRPKAEV